MRPGELWRNRDYLGWLAGESLSALGTSVSSFAYPVLVLLATGSPAKTGLVAAAANVGSLLTLLLGGAVADRWSRRTILVTGPVVQGAVVASVALAAATGHIVLVHVAAAGFVDGAVVGMTHGAARATLRRVVRPSDYATASSAMLARDMGVRVVGPPLGGVLLAAARWLPFAADALSYLASIAGVSMIRRPLGPDVDERAERIPLRRSVAEGLRYVGRHPYLRFVAWWAGVMNLLGAGMMLLVILLVRSHGGAAPQIGAAQGIGSVGGVLGAFAAGRVVRRFAGRGVVIALSWCMAAAMFTMALVPSLWGVAAGLAVVSAVAVPLNVIFDTYEMQIVPDALLGRVGSAVDLAANGLRWLAPITVGFLVDATSAATAAVCWGAVFVLVSLLVQGNRSLHLLDRPIEAVAVPT